MPPAPVFERVVRSDLYDDTGTHPHDGDLVAAPMAEARTPGHC